MPKSPPLIGAHMSIAGGPGRAIDRALSVGCNAMQIFVKNNMQWSARPFSRGELSGFLEHPRRGELRAVFAHSSYLINLAATNASFHRRSLAALGDELRRAAQLELPFLVLHPGAHMGAGEAAGLERVARSLDRVFSDAPDCPAKVALEITAGQGSSLGCSFAHLAEIIRAVREPERLCVCLDTAHLFAAGYDLSTPEGIRKTFREFASTIGWERLAAIHVNDSKTALGSRVDRHACLGRGTMGLEIFRQLMTAPRFRRVPKVLETPKGEDLKEDAENLAILRLLAAG